MPPDSHPPLSILYEDNHLLAVDKPAMLPTMGVEAGAPSLLELAREYVRQRYEKPGNVYLGVVSRLDGPVTGVTLIAKTSKAAGRLSAAFRDREVGKTYLAAVEGVPHPPAGDLENYLRKDERHRKVHVTTAGAEGAQLARLSYRTQQRAGSFALVEIHPETGRKHQIRVQLSKIGCPVVGDMKYGGRASFPLGIALHALRLELEHPVRREPLVIEAPLPASWRRHATVSALL